VLSTGEAGTAVVIDTGPDPGLVDACLDRRHLLVDGAKMSKSKGSFYTLKDLLAREGESAAKAFRYLVVTAHYGTPIDFSWESLRSAASTLRNLIEARARFAKAAGGAALAEESSADAAWKAFEAAMDDDLDAPRAMAALHAFVGDLNRREKAGTLTPAEAAAGVAFLDRADLALGLSLQATRVLSTAERALLDARLAARTAKSWAEADRLRQELAKTGVLVKDGKDGQSVSFA